MSRCIAVKRDGNQCVYKSSYPDGKCGNHTDPENKARVALEKERTGKKRVGGSDYYRMIAEKMDECINRNYNMLEKTLISTERELMETRRQLRRLEERMLAMEKERREEMAEMRKMFFMLAQSNQMMINHITSSPSKEVPFFCGEDMRVTKPAEEIKQETQVTKPAEEINLPVFQEKEEINLPVFQEKEEIKQETRVIRPIEDILAQRKKIKQETRVTRPIEDILVQREKINFPVFQEKDETEEERRERELEEEKELAEIEALYGNLVKDDKCILFLKKEPEKPKLLDVEIKEVTPSQASEIHKRNVMYAMGLDEEEAESYIERETERSKIIRRLTMPTWEEFQEVLKIEDDEERTKALRALDKTVFDACSETYTALIPGDDIERLLYPDQEVELDDEECDKLYDQLNSESISGEYKEHFMRRFSLLFPRNIRINKFGYWNLPKPSLERDEKIKEYRLALERNNIRKMIPFEQTPGTTLYTRFNPDYGERENYTEEEAIRRHQALLNFKCTLCQVKDPVKGRPRCKDCLKGYRCKAIKKDGKQCTREYVSYPYCRTHLNYQKD